MEYFLILGTPKTNTGIECEIECELQIGDYAQMMSDEYKDESLLVVTHRLYYSSSGEHDQFYFFAKRA